MDRAEHLQSERENDKEKNEKLAKGVVEFYSCCKVSRSEIGKLKKGAGGEKYHPIISSQQIKIIIHIENKRLPPVLIVDFFKV